MNVRKERFPLLRTVLEEFPMLPALVGAAILFTLLVLVFGPKSNSDVPGSNVIPALESQDRSISGDTEAQNPADSTASVPVDSTAAVPAESTAAQQTVESSDSVPVDTDADETASTAPAAETDAPDGQTGFTSVDESYFADALFIGDSRTDGLALYCPVGESKHYSAACMTIFDIMDSTESFYGYYGLRNLLQGMQFGKIYFMLGINECGYPNESFMRAYRNAVEEIRRYQPNAIIYLQSILYVTQKHAQEIPIFESYIIQEKNDLIKELANGEDIIYLEVNDALNDGTDHLPSEYTGDGVHLKASYYHLWKDYLMEHAIVDAAHPWTPSNSSTQN